MINRTMLCKGVVELKHCDRIKDKKEERGGESEIKREKAGKCEPCDPHLQCRRCIRCE